MSYELRSLPWSVRKYNGLCQKRQGIHERAILKRNGLEFMTHLLSPAMSLIGSTQIFPLTYTVTAMRGIVTHAVRIIQSTSPCPEPKDAAKY